MLSKKLVCPYFGNLPPWFDKYLANIELLKPLGYDWLITTDLDAFKKRVKEKLDIECPIIPGTGKVWDYRACLGFLFEEELKGYEYHGHADFDCCFGRLDHFMSDDRLSGIDIWSNHADPKEPNGGYVCGPWTLYRNTPLINTLFMRSPHWKSILEKPEPTGWVEYHDGFTGIVDAAHKAGEINRIYTMYQTRDLNNFSTLRWGPEGALLEGSSERMMVHFRRSNPKRWPETL